MIFADPPYFLSNGGISVQSGKQVSVKKGYWDKSQTLQLLMWQTAPPPSVNPRSFSQLTIMPPYYILCFLCKKRIQARTLISLS